MRVSEFKEGRPSVVVGKRTGEEDVRIQDVIEDEELKGELPSRN